MPAPLAKGIIIGATIIVAAGIALYENPRVRQWVDQSRRKIVVAMNGYGEPHAHSPHTHGSTSAEEEWRRHQDQMIRRRRSEIIRKARNQGVAVDLDELARVGTDDEVARSKSRVVKRADSAKSFDDLVGDDGMLKAQAEMQEKEAYATTSSADVLQTPEGFRARGRGEEGLQRGSFFANPFADEEGMGLHDDDLIGASQEEIRSPSTLAVDSPATMTAQSPPQLIDISEAPSTVGQSQTLSIHSLPSVSPAEEGQNMADTTSESFHSFISSPARSRSSSVASGAMTPTSEAFLTSDSVVGSQADDIAVMSPSLHSIHNDDDDSMSEAFSEIGDGQSTPGSWTDVGSEAGSEWNVNHRP